MRRIIELCVAAGGVATLAACGGGADLGQGFAGERERQPPVVEAVEVRYGSLPLEERLVGSVRALNQTEIYTEVAAPIVEVYVADGASVAAGDPLVRLRATDFEERLRQAESGFAVAEARVVQAEANVARHEATRARIETLADRGLATGAELDTARADALSAAADLELMRAQRTQAASLVNERRAELDETVIRAPTAGLVGGRNAEVGQQATTSTPLFVIGDTRTMVVNVTLTQRMLGYVAVGTSVNVYTEADTGNAIRSEIARISPFLHPVAHTTQAEIDIADHDGALRPGMFVTVDVLYGESARAALVPNSALYRHPRDGREGVFVATLAEAVRGGETAEYSIRSPSLEPVGPVALAFAPVRVVARGRNASAIEGVQAADWVVTLGHHLLVAREAPRAIIQPTPWDHILSLQGMQSRDLLEVIAEKQNANLAQGLN